MNEAKQINNLLPKKKPVEKPGQKQSLPIKKPNVSIKKPVLPVKKPIPKPIPKPLEKTVHQKREEQIGKKPVEKEHEFQAFILWQTLPLALKKAFKDEPDLLNQFGYDITDPLLIKLLSINTKGQFAKAFKISPDTITDWTKRPDYKIRFDKLLNETILKWKKDIDFAFIRKLITHGDAARYKLFYQIHGKWAERHEISGPEGGAIKLEDARKTLASRILGITARLRKNKNPK